MLDADPLTDIRNTRRIHSVVTRGRVISPAARQRMLAEVEAARARSSDRGHNPCRWLLRNGRPDMTSSSRL